MVQWRERWQRGDGVEKGESHGHMSLLPHPQGLTHCRPAQVEKAYESGVSGVPHFIIGGKAHVSGAQEPSVFLDIFKSIATAPQ